MVVSTIEPAGLTGRQTNHKTQNVKSDSPGEKTSKTGKIKTVFTTEKAGGE